MKQIGRRRPRHGAAVALACLISSTVALIGFQRATPRAQDAVAPSAASRPIPFPSGYGFPIEAATIAEMLKQQNSAALRTHGWFLWAGLNQPGRAGWPIWRSWNIATQAFAPDPASQPRAALVASAAPEKTGASLLRQNLRSNPPINLNIPFYGIPQQVLVKYRTALQGITLSADIPDGENFQNNGDLMLVSEAYNQPAYDWIRSQKLYRKDTLVRLFRNGDKDIATFPRDAMVLKHMYWPVKSTGLTALPVADMAKYLKPPADGTTYVGFENKDRWSKAVAIDPTRATIPAGERRPVTYLYDVSTSQYGTVIGPTTYDDAKVVPISSFFHKQLSQAEFDALSVYDRLLIDASFYWVHGRLFQDGDYLAAVASHVITQEDPGWTLQTFWWHDEPEAGPYAADRPIIPAAEGPWQHYLMNIEDGIPASGGTTLPIVYNPYIELASHPVVTNCRNCHVRAGWPDAQYMTPGGPGPLADLKIGDPFFRDQLSTNFLWTIPDRAN